MLKNEADRRGALIGEEGDLGEARGPNESIGSGGSFWAAKTGVVFFSFISSLIVLL